MNRVRIFGYAGIGLILAALGWFLTVTPHAVAEVTTDMLSRSAGLALLGLAMIAIGLAFRAATHAEQKPASTAIRPQTSEYRRGFGHSKVRAQAQLRQSTQRGVVVSLRRAVAEQGIAPARVETGTALPMTEIERLQTMLHSRVARLTTRDADMTKRPSTRSGIDLHDLAPQ